MRGALRRIRRSKWVVAAALVAVGAVAAALLVGNTAKPDLPVTNRPTIVQHEAKAVGLTAADRQEIVTVSRLFLVTAVRRDHAERAWRLVSATLRSGTTLRDWKAGLLPFPPFPVRGARWNLAYSVKGEVGLDVLVLSSDPEISPLVHRLTLVRNPASRKPAWLVDGWVAMGSVSGELSDSPFPAGAAGEDIPRSTPSPGRFWILTPLIILVVALLLPFLIIANSHLAERRMRRRRARSHPRPN